MCSALMCLWALSMGRHSSRSGGLWLSQAAQAGTEPQALQLEGLLTVEKPRVKESEVFLLSFAGCRKAGVPEPISAGPAPAVQCTAITFLLPCALSSPGSSRASAGFPFHS